MGDVIEMRGAVKVASDMELLDDIIQIVDSWISREFRLREILIDEMFRRCMNKGIGELAECVREVEAVESATGAGWPRWVGRDSSGRKPS